MTAAPWFWREDGLAARLVRAGLAPAAFAYDAGQRTRAFLARPMRTTTPLICVGAASVGGAGKTPTAIAIARMLQARGLRPVFLTRGYRGVARGPLCVDPDTDEAASVGDEPLLLARTARTVMAKDRRAGAAFADSLGADVVIMDDGFQNPTIEKDAAILLVRNGASTARAVLPAGPWREPPDRASARADLVMAIDGATPSVEGRPVFTAHSALEKNGLGELRAGPPALAFCGVAAPERFFAALEAEGVTLAAVVPFPDHHAFSEAELRRLERERARLGAVLVTTEKDFARLPPLHRDGIRPVPMRMLIDDEPGLFACLSAAIRARRGRPLGTQAPEPA